MNVLQWVLIYGLLAYYSINIVTVIKILKNVQYWSDFPT